jgi:hypothetical protein
MARIARAIVDHAWVIIGTVALITAVFAFFARNARIDSSVGTLVDPENPEVLYHQRIQQIFATDEIDIVIVVADDIFQPASLAKIKDLSARLAGIPGVAKVSSIATERTISLTADGDIDNSVVMEQVPTDAAGAARVRARVFENPLLINNLISKDGKAAAILITYDRMSEAALAESGIHDQIDRIIAATKGPERIFLTGIPTLKVRSAQLMRADVLTFGPLVFAVVCVVLLLAFRTLRGMLLPAVTTGIGLIWTVGLMGYFDIPIDIGTLVLPTLLIAIGNAYATHVVARYYEEIGTGGSAKEITERIIRHLGTPVLVTALSTVFGFASLIVYRISAIRHLGIFSVFGITILFGLALTFTTALLVLSRLRAGRQSSQESPWIESALDRIGRFDMRHRTAVMVCSLLCVAVFGWGIRYVRVETSYLSYFPADSPIHEATAALSAHLGGQAAFLVVVEGPEENSIVRLDTLRRMAALQDFIDRLDGIDKTTSLVDYIKLLNQVFHDNDPAYYGLPETDAAVEQYLLMLDPETIDNVVNANFTLAALLIRSHLHSSIEMAEAIERIERFAADAFPTGFSVRPTGTAVILDRTADDLSQGQVQSVVAALVVVFSILSLHFLSPRFGLVAMGPNLIPIIMFFGILGWCGISLSLSTAMIASISLGIGVDEAVHLLSEFNHHVRKHADQEQAILSALRSVGPPVVYTTAALMFGFLVLYWSNFVPLRQFGLLSALNVFVSLWVDLLILPAILVSTRFVTLFDVLNLKLGGAAHEEIPLFRGLRPSQARVAALMGVLKTIAKGQMIVAQGEAADAMYVVIRGRARVSARDDGRINVLGEVGRGDVIGEMGLLRGAPRSADVTALEDTELLVVSKRFLEVLRRRYPRIAATVLSNLTQILSDRLERAQSHGRAVATAS